MSTEDNKTLMRRFFEEAWNRHDADKVADFFAPVRRARQGARWVNAPVASYMRALRSWCAAFPDLHIEIDKLVAEGDTVVAYFTCTGTHTGAFTQDGLTIPPTGRRISHSEVYFFGYEDGKVVEYWSRKDRLGLLEQLGVADRAAEAQPAP